MFNKLKYTIASIVMQYTKQQSNDFNKFRVHYYEILNISAYVFILQFLYIPTFNGN